MKGLGVGLENFANAKNSVHQLLAGVILADSKRDSRGSQTSGGRVKEHAVFEGAHELAS